MQGTIAQLLSLAAHGNHYLAGCLDDSYYPDNSTFKYCKFVKFMDLQRSGTRLYEREYAGDPNSWFKKLKEAGVVQLRVRYISTNKEQVSDRLSVAFVGGGGRWLIEVVKPTNSDFWEASWAVGDRDDPQRNIWHVKYGRILRDARQPEPPVPLVKDVKQQLQEALKRISVFAHMHNCTNFGDCFDQGLKALNDPPFNSDKEYQIFPDAYASTEYHQLLSACQRAWVFGGMGSWNDIGFNDAATQNEYVQLSDNLFNLINLSLIVASNPFPRPAAKIDLPGNEQSRKWWQLWKKG